jgi:thiamine-phosphate pyrophosphorylase
MERLGLDSLLVAEGFLEGGARILQFRHKGFWSRDTFALAKQVSDLCRAAGAMFVVNDRADYAAMLRAGLHLGQDDLAPSDARRVIGTASPVGFSTHNPAQMRAAQTEPIDYVAFGPVFPTVSKERPDPTVGLTALRAVRAMTALPLVAIGGITRANAQACFHAGADSVAVISDLLPVSCPLSGLKQTIRDRMAEWQKLNQR